mgnify:CR=1 FL=1
MIMNLLLLRSEQFLTISHMIKSIFVLVLVAKIKLQIAHKYSNASLSVKIKALLYTDKKESSELINIRFINTGFMDQHFLVIFLQNYYFNSLKRVICKYTTSF